MINEENIIVYHEIGRILDMYLLANTERAQYGAQTIVRLAGDVGIGKTALYQALGFFRLHPIFHSRGKLTWTHYRYLLSLPTVKLQQQYETEAIENGWTARELEAQIRAGAVAEQLAELEMPKLSPDLNLPALRGDFYTYRLLESGNRFLVDLGFGIHSGWPLVGLDGLRTGARVRVVKGESSGFGWEEAVNRSASFYTYRAQVLEVVDGDTLWLAIDCGFWVWTKQKVRLRGIDAPELPTAAGVRAKDFVRRALDKVPFVVVTTTKPDKYDRYLADVFYGDAKDDAETVLEKGVFLNKELIARGLVTRFRES